MAQPSDTVPVEKYRALVDKLELLEQELGQKTVAMLSQRQEIDRMHRKVAERDREVKELKERLASAGLSTETAREEASRAGYASAGGARAGSARPVGGGLASQRPAGPDLDLMPPLVRSAGSLAPLPGGDGGRPPPFWGG